MRLRDLFSGKTKALELDIKELQEALENCNAKLIEIQEHINQTNSYWKKKMREKSLKSKKSDSKGGDAPLLDA
jgi:hypothetical protein